ncbi:MAG TPA: hypothetical protein VGT07_10930 [Steroidobacteraceae bacterium]|nr:hypothetical protein [Steroidobacteraceae bacterium]
MIRARHPSQRHPSQRRGILATLILCVVVVAVFVAAAALFIGGLLGVALLIVGISSWLHPVDVAFAWARTLAGLGLIGGSSGLAALGWLAVERLAAPLGELARLGHRVLDSAPAAQTSLRRARGFIAVIGILLALICLPFAAAIHANSHGPWLGWGETRAGGP